MSQGTSPFSDLDFVRDDEPLSKYAWYRVGGPARYFVQPRNPEELAVAYARCVSEGIDVYVLGLGANVLIADEGVTGAVFRLDQPHFTSFEVQQTRVTAGAGYDMQKLAKHTARKGLGGLACMCGIYGTVGGGIRMNAGGRFGEIGDTCQRVTVMQRDGNVTTLERHDLRFEYRNGNISAPFILGAEFELEDVGEAEATREIKEVWMYKTNSQPLNARSAGCMFKNPPEGSAGKIIDEVGLKGMRLGSAEVSGKHANFILAHEGCTATDIIQLMDLVQRRVLEQTGIALHGEVQRWPHATAAGEATAKAEEAA
ncbi:MAG: UDP-N-acetylmuramate dehydrogenase [Phycisphaerae bacterium]